MMQIISNRKALELERNTLKSYLQMKMNSEDWHAVADAAMDLREIDAKLSILPLEILNPEGYQPGANLNPNFKPILNS